MINSQVKQIINTLEYHKRCEKLRKEFLEHGVKFYDKYGTGYIRDGVKNYTEKW